MTNIYTNSVQGDFYVHLCAQGDVFITDRFNKHMIHSPYKEAVDSWRALSRQPHITLGVADISESLILLSNFANQLTLSHVRDRVEAARRDGLLDE